MELSKPSETLAWKETVIKYSFLLTPVWSPPKDLTTLLITQNPRFEISHLFQDFMAAIGFQTPVEWLAICVSNNWYIGTYGQQQRLLWRHLNQTTILSHHSQICPFLMPIHTWPCIFELYRKAWLLPPPDYTVLKRDSVASPLFLTQLHALLPPHLALRLEAKQQARTMCWCKFDPQTLLSLLLTQEGSGPPPLPGACS